MDLKDSASPTLGGRLERWFSAGVASGWRPSTVRTYALVVREYLLPSLGDRSVRSLDGTDITRFQAEMIAAGLAPASISLCRAVLSSVFRQAIADGLIERSPLNSSRPLRRERFVGNTLTPSQARCFLAGIKGDRYEALFVLALSLGMRSGELRALRWCDIDIEARLIMVRSTIDDSANLTGRPKSDRSLRILPLPEAAARLLLDSPRKGEFIFATSSGRPVDRSGLSKHFKRILVRLGLPALRFHDLRHSAASFMIANGIELRVIGDLLGHSSVRTTADVYGHILPSVRAGAIAMVESLLNADLPPAA